MLDKAAVCVLLVAAIAVAPAPAARSTIASDCTTSNLVVWLNTTGNGTAGSIYYKLEFTNESGHPCSLFGYAGVSAVNLAGHQLGSAGGRTTSPTHVVILANGATASANLQVAEAGNYPSSACHMTSAAGVRVYPPDQTASKVVPFPFQACSRRGPVILHVWAVR